MGKSRLFHSAVESVEVTGLLPQLIQAEETKGQGEIAGQRQRKDI